MCAYHVCDFSLYCKRIITKLFPLFLAITPCLCVALVHILVVPERGEDPLEVWLATLLQRIPIPQKVYTSFVNTSTIHASTNISQSLYGSSWFNLLPPKLRSMILSRCSQLYTNHLAPFSHLFSPTLLKDCAKYSKPCM